MGLGKSTGEAIVLHSLYYGNEKGLHSRGMSCPPGTVLNPRSFRCVRVTGRRAKQLINQGNIPDYYAGQAAPAFYYRSPQRKTVKQRKPAYQGPSAYGGPAYGEPSAYGGPVYGGPSAYGAQVLQRQQAYQRPQQRPIEPPCPPGKIRNPASRRCINQSGKIYQQIFGTQQPARPPSRQDLHRTSSEGRLRLPVGSAAPAPLGTRPAILGWMAKNCSNQQDPITGKAFTSADTTALQEVIRLHNRTCTLASPLNDHVLAQHVSGAVATIPGDRNTHMTLDDFKALRDTMRRTNPAYKLPPRKHQPPPVNWRLYIETDNRSGPDFMSVMYVDVAKAIRVGGSVQYPVNAVKVDLGFLPRTLTGGLCAPEMIVDLVQRLAASNRLLTPVAGGWKPIAGFPFRKSDWSGADAYDKLGKLCRALAKALATPL